MAGAVLRFWGLPRLGLSQFDEGIYAIAGLWSVSPRGLASLDSTLIPYAPPGFPILVGIAYLGLGVSDLAAILVSILAGTLTIPAAAWLARRTSGAGAGAAAAAWSRFRAFTSPSPAWYSPTPRFCSAGFWDLSAASASWNGPGSPARSPWD